MIPGSNLFSLAARIVRPQAVGFRPFSGRVPNASRQWVSTFGPVVTIQASVQAISLKVYQEFGLDLKKKYVRIFCAQNVIDLDRDYSGDQFIWNKKVYQIDSDNQWFLQDGWASCMAVETKDGVPT